MESEAHSRTSGSENELDSESEIEVYSLECSGSDNEVVESSEDSGTERAWGSNRKLFYEGNDSDSDDHLEEEINFTQKKLISATCTNDYSSPWLEAADYKHFVEVPVPGVQVETEEPVFEKTSLSFEKTASWLIKYGLQLVDQCCKSLFMPESNAYIQSKIHLMFCYELNVLYFLLLRMNQSKHPVLQQMRTLHELFLHHNKIDAKLKTALLHSPVCKLEADNLTRISTSVSHVPLLPAAAQTPLEYYNLVRDQQNVDLTYPFQPLSSKEYDVMEEKRAITYQIASNKGLLPKRKKEQRNPRVKHRKKYRKALIKRKSQVLPVVHELFRYGGEQCGIRQLVRSIK